jgi:hypothetical protein
MDRLEPPGNASIRVALHQDVIIASRDAAKGNLKAVRSWSKPVDRRSDLIRADHHDPVWASPLTIQPSQRMARRVRGGQILADHPLRRPVDEDDRVDRRRSR